jgi:hypothetical protein
MPWTTEQILALAPDASSAKSGKDNCAPRKWKTLGMNDACVWGEIQGSGKDPYQISIDLAGPAFKCTCPSRKFPCKHGLGLFLMVIQQPGALTEKQPPAWTTEWLVKRVEKEAKKIAVVTAPEVPLDPEAQKKSELAAERRAASRESRVTAGLDELNVWLKDLVRTGFATLPGKPASFWETPAARLVDAQATGVARRLQALDGVTTTGDRWPARLLRETALLHLVREGWSRLAELPSETQADLRAVIGFTTSQEEVYAQPGVSDRWVVLAQCLEQEERLRAQRTWLFGTQSKRFALCLSFSAAPNQPLDVSLVPGTAVAAELVFFPGMTPLRALVRQRHGSPEFVQPQLPQAGIAAAMEFAAASFTGNPWLERVPFALARVIPVQRAHGWMVRDETGHCLPLETSEAKAWTLAALSGGRPMALAGEWNREAFRPLSVWAEGRFLRL